MGKGTRNLNLKLFGNALGLVYLGQILGQDASFVGALGRIVDNGLKKGGVVDGKSGIAQQGARCAAVGNAKNFLTVA